MEPVELSVSDEARNYLVELLEEAVKTETDDWENFPEDFEGDGHPVHRVRELLVAAKGGRFPVGNSHRFDDEEFELYRRRECLYQVSTVNPFAGLDAYCRAPVSRGTGSGVDTKSTMCAEHAEDVRVNYGWK